LSLILISHLNIEYIVNTVKLGYNEQLRTDQICSL
jgi:hypothetical protein